MNAVCDDPAVFRFGPIPKSQTVSARRQMEIARAVLGEHLSDETLKSHADQVNALARTGISAEELLRRWRGAGL